MSIRKTSIKCNARFHKKLPESEKMNLTKFKIFLSIPLIYILAICFFMVFVINYTITNEITPNFALTISNEVIDYVDLFMPLVWVICQGCIFFLPIKKDLNLIKSKLR